jgi:hypothetical protein
VSETVKRADVLATLAALVPDFAPERVLSVQVTAKRLTADIVTVRPAKCWKTGCLNRETHSHPKTWDVR